MVLRRFLPEEHAGAETRDLVKLGMGLIGTMTALVLGLLIASAKSSFDTQRNGLAQLAGNVVFLDRTLAHYGPETKEVRDMLRFAVTDMLQRTWPEEYDGGKSRTEGRYEVIYDKIQALTPKNDAQQTLKAQAWKVAADIGQTRWLLFAQKGRSIPTPFLVVMVSWLTLLFASFALFAPSNATVLVTFLVCALSIASAVLLILELDQPFDGLLRLSSEPLRDALEQLGR
jgi:hypothetical protein